MADLEKMILAKKQGQFNGFLNYMESKYGDVAEDEEEDVKAKNVNSKRIKKGKTSEKNESSGQKRRKMK